MVYRIWAASRRDDIKKWEIANMAGWDSSGPQRSALKASLNRAVNMEIARTEGLAAGGILWNFEGKKEGPHRPTTTYTTDS